MKNKPKPKGSILAALDIGSSKIACFIARVVDDEGNFQVVGVGHQASRGVRSGSVVDMNAAADAVRHAVHAAEDMAESAIRGFPLREVVVNLPGIHAQSHNFKIDVEIAGQDVTDNDLRRALARAQSHAVTDGSELVHTIPVAYTIDGQNGIREPRGMYGEMLEVDVHLVTGNSAALRNIAACIDHSHLDIAALCESGYAAGLACLVEDEMDMGCTVVDMGGGLTTMAVFFCGALVYADAVRLGGQHVTSDIARGLGTALNDAERLKVLYGSAMASSMDQSELIDVPQIGEDRTIAPNHMPRSELVGIIQPRLEETLNEIRARLHDSGAGRLAGRRVILTGGASQISGMRDLAQIVLEKQVRLGRPLRADGLADAVSGPAFATAAGLLTYIATRSSEIPSEIVARLEPGNVWERLQLWVRENW